MSPYLELDWILPESRYTGFALTTHRKLKFYCCVKNIGPWTSHMTPSQCDVMHLRESVFTEP
jgi:hypothetical protein